LSPRKDPVEEKRSRLNDARESPGSEGSLAILRAGLSDRVSIVVARAADLAGELGIATLIPEMIAAFDRFLVDPSKDKGCLAKTAIVEALTRLEHPDPEVFLAGIRHVQREPVWGGSEDTAAWLRGLSAIGLVGCDHPRLLTHLVDVLADREKLARLGAARALGGLGRPEGAHLIRLKLLHGDPEIEVLSECFRAFLSLEPQAEAAAFVARFLDSGDEAIAEAAALALGESRYPQALEVLKGSWERSRGSPGSHGKSFRRVLLVAMALLRTGPATEFLVSLVSGESTESAQGALSALGPFLYNDELRERVRAVVAAKEDSSLLEFYESELRRNRMSSE
jgi:HEAT repeat protein